MKIRITDVSKKVIALDKAPVIERMRNELKDNDFTGDIESAVCFATGWCGMDIVKAEAEIARNSRVWNYYNEQSEDYDIWFTIWAFDQNYGFYTIGAYLSDIWQIGPREMNDTIRGHMWIRAYKEV